MNLIRNFPRSDNKTIALNFNEVKISFAVLKGNQFVGKIEI